MDAVAANGWCVKRPPSVALTQLKGLLALVRQSSLVWQGSNYPDNEETADSGKKKLFVVKVAFPS